MHLPRLCCTSILPMIKTRMLLNYGCRCYPCQSPHFFFLSSTTHTLFSRFPRTTVSTTLEDSHVYVCKRAVLELLNDKPKFTSLREDFLPWLCKLQYRHSASARPPKIGIVIHDKPDLATRINTLHNFYEINKRVNVLFLN